MRVIVGLMIISAGVAIAFFRKDGLTAEQWIVNQIKFWLRPQKRVWTRSDGEGLSTRDQVAEIEIDQPGVDASRAGYGIEIDAQGLSHVRLLSPTARSVESTSAVVVLIDMAMLLSLFTFAVYLLHGGLEEIQGWFQFQIGR